MTFLRSIAWRILFFHLVAALAAAALTMISLYEVLRQTSERLDFDFHVAQATDLFQQLTWSEEGILKFNPTPDMSAHFSDGYGRYAFDVFDGAGRWLLGSSGGAALRRTIPFTASSIPLPFSSNNGANSFSGATVPIKLGEQSVWVRSYENLSHPDALQDDLLRLFLPRIFWITLIVAILTLFADWRFVRGAFAGLAAVERAASALRPGDPPTSLQWQSAPSEVSEFVKTIDATLSRLTAAYLSQRQFASDASHELRTPLAVLRMRVDLIEDASLRATLARDVDAMTQTVIKFIELADLGTLVLNDAERSELNAVCDSVVDQQALTAASRQVELKLMVHPASTTVVGNATLVASAVRNLVENAVRFSPPGSAVEICVEPSAVIVRDRGLGIEPEALAQIFDRRQRANRPGSASSGLGLAIVQQVMAHLGGHVSVAARDGGGCEFHLQFQSID